MSGTLQVLRETEEGGSENGTKAGGQKPAKIQAREQLRWESHLSHGTLGLPNDLATPPGKDSATYLGGRLRDLTPMKPHAMQDPS